MVVIAVVIDVVVLFLNPCLHHPARTNVLRQCIIVYDECDALIQPQFMAELNYTSLLCEQWEVGGGNRRNTSNSSRRWEVTGGR